MASPGQQIEVTCRVHSLAGKTVRTLGQRTSQTRTGPVCTPVPKELFNPNITLGPGTSRTKSLGSANRVIESNGHDSAQLVERARVGPEDIAPSHSLIP